MNAVVSLLERSVAASVVLDVVVPEGHPSAPLLGTRRHGSGVMFDSLGLLVTANYVTLGAHAIRVRTVDHRQWTGRRIAQDFQSGLAVVAIEESGHFPALPLRASADLVVGEGVFLLAAVPDNGRRVHNGAVSGLDPFDAYWEYHLDRAVFTTAPNPGFGGGALIDRHGSVRGVVLLELAEIGRFTMATPVDALLENREAFFAGQLKRRPRRGWLGLFCYPVSNHVVVGGVVPGSPAALAGLQSGDVVLTVDDERIHDRYALYTALWKRMPGERVHLRVYRNNQVLVLSAELGDAEAFFA